VCYSLDTACKSACRYCTIRYTLCIYNCIYKMILPLYTVRKKNARKSPNYMPKYKKDKKNKNIFCKVKFFIAHNQSQGIPQS
jgi:hypothetical protein